jgi:hypothetical protein
LKTDREHLLELRKELNELTQLVILLGIQITELHSLDRAKQVISDAKNGTVPCMNRNEMTASAATDQLSST